MMVSGGLACLMCLIFPEIVLSLIFVDAFSQSMVEPEDDPVVLRGQGGECLFDRPFGQLYLSSNTRKGF